MTASAPPRRLPRPSSGCGRPAPAPWPSTRSNPAEARRGWAPNDRDHRKIMVVDGRIGMTGGVNLDRVYENSCEVAAAAEQDPAEACWRDAALRIEGPAVAGLQKLFLETWEKQRGPPLPRRDWFPKLEPRGPARVRILGSVPGEKRPRFYVTLLTAIAAVRQRLWLTTGYFVPTWQQRHELRQAARRGVQVRLLLPSISDSADALAAQRAAYDDMLEAGIEIREVQGAVLHAKLVVADGVWSADRVVEFRPPQRRLEQRGGCDRARRRHRGAAGGAAGARLGTGEAGDAGGVGAARARPAHPRADLAGDHRPAVAGQAAPRHRLHRGVVRLLRRAEPRHLERAELQHAVPRCAAAARAACRRRGPDAPP